MRLLVLQAPLMPAAEIGASTPPRPFAGRCSDRPPKIQPRLGLTGRTTADCGMKRGHYEINSPRNPPPAQPPQSHVTANNQPDVGNKEVSKGAKISRKVNACEYPLVFAFHVVRGRRFSESSAADKRACEPVRDLFPPTGKGFERPA
jgi:hypothetical protein